MINKYQTKQNYNVWMNHTKVSTIGQTNKQNLERFVCGEYDVFILTAPVNENTGQPLPPNQQLLALWIVTAWDKIPENW